MKSAKYALYLLAALLLLALLAGRLFFSRHRAAPAEPATAAAGAAISWEDADKYVGKTITVEGTIAGTHNSGKACFLNFHKNWKKYLTVVIFASDFPRFPEPPEKLYLDKHIKVTGTIKTYRDRLEIIADSPSQIEEVK